MENIKEIWKGIEGYENLYQISSEGRVKSLGNNKNRKEKILNGRKNRGGYLIVSLCKEGKGKNYLIHRLVANAFLPNPNNLPEVNHKDENPKNNCVENLEWCDRYYNNNYGKHNEKIAKAKSIPVIQFSKTGDFIRRWNSAKEVEMELGFDSSSVTACCKGKRYKSVGGFKWGYADDYERIPFKVFDLEIYEKKVA
jgi:hypothetical protein